MTMADNIEQLRQQIKEQGDTVRELKTSKADGETVKQQVAVLLSLKEKLRIATDGDEASAKASKAVALKTPKGTKDYNDKEMSVRTKIFNTIVNVFEKHGA
ncbi:Cytoplasmic and mitochondrial histidine tRNA synthetase, partial [Coemansia erecta]